MLQRFQVEQKLPLSVEEAFAFVADPHNLPRLMPGWMGVRLERLELVQPEGWSKVAAGVGSRIEISYRLLPFLPVRLRWVAAIAEFVPHQYFCDVQAHGPVRRFRHCHRVLAADDGGCLLRDQIEYDLGLGVLGWPVNVMLFRPAMRALFAARQRKTLALLARADRPEDSRRDGAATRSAG